MILTGANVTAANVVMTNTVPVPTYYFKPPSITTIHRNTMIGGWGYPEEGRFWFNTTSTQWEMWAGREVVLLG